MHAGVARPGVAAAVAEGVELLDIADVDRGLRRHPVAQADLEGAVRQRIERAERQAGAGVALRIGRDQDARLLGLDGDDRRGQPHFDRCQRRVGHLPIISFQIEPEGFALERGEAGAQRLDRGDHAAVAAEDAVGMTDQHDVGRAVFDDPRIARAMAASSRPGLSAQAEMKAPAVERLMPA